MVAVDEQPGLPPSDDARFAQTIVQAEAIHLAHQLAALRLLCSDDAFATHSISGSLTITTAASFGRKLNRTAAFGMSGPVTRHDLLAVERAYASPGLPPAIDLCEYADATAAPLLAPSYTPVGSLCTFHHHLVPASALEPPDVDVDVDVLPTTDPDPYIAASVDGFHDTGRAPALLRLLAAAAAHRPDTTLFLARVRGALAGTAATAYLDVGPAAPRVALLYLDSTLPPFRGQGVHAALIRARLRAARQAGCHVAIAAARVGSASARNLERAGMRPLYGTTMLSKAGEGS